jgi:hypothetical protein
MNIYPVLDDAGLEIVDLHIVELSAPRGNYDDLYATGREGVG